MVHKKDVYSYLFSFCGVILIDQVTELGLEVVNSSWRLFNSQLTKSKIQYTCLLILTKNFTNHMANKSFSWQRIPVIQHRMSVCAWEIETKRERIHSLLFSDKQLAFLEDVLSVTSIDLKLLKIIARTSNILRYWVLTFKVQRSSRRMVDACTLVESACDLPPNM